MAREQFENNYSTLLNGSITNSVTTLTVDAVPITMTASFRIKIGSEIILVGTVSGLTFIDCTRGVEGTTAASHADNEPVTHILTARSLQQAAPIGRNLADVIPSTQESMSEEWEGTEDTLPTDWAWVSAAPPILNINSWYPSMLLIERSGETTERKLRRSNFTMAATSGLWFKFGNGQTIGSSSQYEWIIYDSASSDGYGFGVHNGAVLLARDSNAGSLSNRGTWSLAAGAGWSNQWYMGVKRVSNTWTTHFSVDGIHWQQIQSADTRSFTVARLEMRWSTDNSTGNPRASVDWIRYRADNEFPRP